MWWLIPFLLLNFSFSQTLCIRDVENETNEPYLSYALLKTMEKAILESGYSLKCPEGEVVKVRVVEFRENPIAYTPSQRVSSYNLTLRIDVEIGKKRFSVGGTVPYSLPSGSLGDIPRRKAIDDLLDKIYLEILENVRR